jgi:adenylate cyclase class 2
LEIEIKFRVADHRELEAKLRTLGFRQKTPRTHEMNLIYDFENRRLAKNGSLLRIRQFGERWTVTHKSKGSVGRHKHREEIETVVHDGARLGKIFEALGMSVVFRYEKFRGEWTDRDGHVVLDETPIGDFAEIEGEPAWIDEVAEKLGVSHDQYITRSYADLFFEWKRQTGSAATDLTFTAVAQL